MKKLITIFAVFFFLSGLCLAEEKPKNVYKATVNKDGIQRIDIRSGDFYYNPDYIIVKVNVPVALYISSPKALAPHNIVIDAPEAGMKINKKYSTKKRRIRFTPTKVGKYPFFCDLPTHGISASLKTHQDLGMEGMIEVIE